MLISYIFNAGKVSKALLNYLQKIREPKKINKMRKGVRDYHSGAERVSRRVYNEHVYVVDEGAYDFDLCIVHFSVIYMRN